MNTKNNLRFRESQCRLENAMLELMNQTDFEKITVRKLCETAQVNRSTFYAHFVDLYDMLEQMESRLHQELLDSLPATVNPEDMFFSPQVLVLFLQHIRAHRHFYRIALRTRKEFPLPQSFEPMWNQVIKPRCRAAGILSEAEMMYYFVYFQAGFTMVLKRWVDCDCQESETDLAATLCNSLPSCLASKKQPDARPRLD